MEVLNVYFLGLSQINSHCYITRFIWHSLWGEKSGSFTCFTTASTSLRILLAVPSKLVLYLFNSAANFIKVKQLSVVSFLYLFVEVRFQQPHDHMVGDMLISRACLVSATVCKHVYCILTIFVISQPIFLSLLVRL